MNESAVVNDEVDAFVRSMMVVNACNGIKQKAWLGRNNANLVFLPPCPPINIFLASSCGDYLETFTQAKSILLGVMQQF